jgi:hypothetical protein
MKKKQEDRLLKWSADKKQAKDLEREQKRAKQIIGEKYEDWKKELCSKPRTRKEVIAFLYRLRDMVLDHAKDCAALKLKDFSDFTYAVIERHLSSLITAHITGHNVLKQHVPVTLVAGGQVAMAKTEVFRNKEELLKVDFVKWFTEQPGFTNLTWTRVEKPLDIEFYLLAHYASGDSWLVGTLINDTGLEGIPCYDDQADYVIEDFVKLRQSGSTAKAGEAPATAPLATPGETSTPSAGADPTSPGESR